MSKDIIKLIETKKSWDSKKLVKAIKKMEEVKIEINFCHIGGYELLRDGTKTDEITSLVELIDFLDEQGFEYDKTITDPYELAESVSKQWKYRYSDGGGSAWIEM